MRPSGSPTDGYSTTSVPVGFQERDLHPFDYFREFHFLATPLAMRLLLALSAFLSVLVVKKIINGDEHLRQTFRRHNPDKSAIFSAPPFVSLIIQNHLNVKVRNRR
jgi:hypothetical protein